MNKMSFNCIPCHYETTKKHIYERHMKSEAHMKREAHIEAKAKAKAKANANANANVSANANANVKKEKEKQLCVCGNYYKSLLTHQNSCSTFKKEKEKEKETVAIETIEEEKQPINKALYEKASADFYKYMCDKDEDVETFQSTFKNLKDNDTTTITTIVDDTGNTIVEKTTYSTTNSCTDYDIHIDSADFIKMMNTSLSTLKETGDRKSFVNNFFQYMFKHVTDIRHTSDE